jgi:hypothetical protein
LLHQAQLAVQKFTRPEKRSSRLELLATPEIYPNELAVDAFEEGLLNWGVFVRLNASPRKIKLKRSVIGNVRDTLVLRLKSPGPRTEFLPAVPKRQRASNAGVEVEQG